MDMHRPYCRSVFAKIVVTLLLLMACDIHLIAQDGDSESKSKTRQNPSDALTPPQWKQLDSAVDEGLKFLATQQQPNGAFKSHDFGQPAVTSLCVMAYLSRGHVPNEGPYGEKIARAIDFVISTQQPNGLLFKEGLTQRLATIVGTYNHAIAGVMLGEVYGMSNPQQQQAIRTAIEKALRFSRSEQMQPKSTRDQRGWRYLENSDYTSDLSVTAWHLMFYRSARNAEFDVPKEHIDEAMAYIERCYEPKQGTFSYGLNGSTRTYFSRGMAGAGAVSLALAGKHETEMAKNAGRYILDHPFDRFNRGGLTKEDRFYYGAYYCSQAMYQLGGKEWERFYAVLLKTMAENQSPDGSWDLEANQDGVLGHAYSTAFAILSLTPPYQLLPVYQR